jgi:D-alanine-D-alanine ligase
MKVGLTYDLRSDYLREGFSEEETAEFDKESTVEAIELALQRLGYETDRIGHFKALIGRLYEGDRWDIVFNICEGMHGIGREAQVPALLDAFNIPYTFSDPLVLALTLHKGMTKRVMRDSGVPTPDFAIAETINDLTDIHLPYPLFVKPNSEGSGKGIGFNSKVNTPDELRTSCLAQWEAIDQPLLIETYLPGREFTTGVLGTGKDSFSIGSMEVIFNSSAKEKIYSYDIKTNYEQYVSYALPEKEMAEKCSELALKAWKALGCRDAGRIDIRVDRKGVPNFIEINPLAGLNDITSDLPILARMNGYTYDFIIKTIMDSAIKRIQPNKNPCV